MVVASHPGRLVFLYVPFVDLAAHMHGQASREYAKALSLADTIWGRLCTSPDPLSADRLPDGVLFPDPGWTVFARYMNDRLVGYHGGLTDQERLIPVLVR